MTGHAVTVLTRKLPTKKLVICIAVHTKTHGVGHTAAFLSVYANLVFRNNKCNISGVGQTIDSEGFTLSV